MDSVQKTLREAAAPTFERIRNDLERSPAAVQPLLLYIEKNLFHPDLDANQLKRACGIRDNSLPVYFHNVLRLPPYAYIMDCRMEVACRLLRSSRLKLWQIAQVLGFSTLQVFSRAFLRWSGCRPSAYRRHGEAAFKRDPNALRDSLEKLNIEIPPDIADLPMPVISVGAGSEEDETQVNSHAAKLPLALAAGAENLTVGKVVDRKALLETERRCAVEEVWPALRDLPLEQARQTMRCYNFQTTALFDVLREKALVEGRQDRRRGLEWNQMALASLDSLEEPLGEGVYEQRALGWAWLGNTRRLMLDFAGAERSFVRSYRELSMAPSEARNPVVQGEIFTLEGTLRMFQRRLDEAVDLMGRALVLFDKAGDRQQKCRTLGQRSSCYLYSDQWRLAAQDLQEAVHLSEAAGEPDIVARHFLNLANVNVRAGSFDDARRYLKLHQQHRHVADYPLAALALWIEANVDHGQGLAQDASSRYLAAQTAYDKLKDPFHASMVALDFAILLVEEGRDREVTQIVDRIFPVFETYNLNDEARNSLLLLQKAVSRLSVDQSALRLLRTSIRRDPLASTPARDA